MNLSTLKRIKLNTYLGESASVAAINAGRFVIALSSSIGIHSIASCLGDLPRSLLISIF